MTRLGLRLEDIPDTIGWHAAYIFSRHLPMDSALFRSRYPQYSSFSTTLQTNAILANIVDALMAFKYEWDSAHAKQGAQIEKPKRFPLPWLSDEEQGKKTYGGRGSAMAVGEFWDWFFNRDEDEENTDGKQGRD